MAAVAGILALACLPLSLMLDEMGVDDAIVCGVLGMAGVLSAATLFLV
jgi:hypothetical protein